MQKRLSLLKILKREKNLKITPFSKFYSKLSIFKPSDFPTIGQESLEIQGYDFPNVLTNVPPTKTSTLSNGLRVITEQRKGQTASVGVFILAGSRNETKENNGVAHFLEHMFFKGTTNKTATQLELDYEISGAQLNAHTSREYTCFQSHCLVDDVARSVESLSDILFNSNIYGKDVDAERSTILREKQDVETNIEEVLFDRLHECAYQQSSLGLTILGTDKNIQTLTRQNIVEFKESLYIGPRMVLVGVGDINHNDFVNLAERHFSKVKAESKKAIHEEKTKYIGSEVKIYDDHIPYLYQSIAFQGPSLHSPDILSVNLIQILLGSWDKAMGAGKHISSNLCSYVAEHDLARNISSFNHSYSDTGLFGVQTVSDGEDASTEELSIQVMSQMTRLCYSVNEEELIRAKNVLKNQILSQYEGRLDNICEEIGKQMLFYGRRPSSAEMFARIDCITSEQIVKVAQKYIYDKDPVSASIGKVAWALDWNWLRSFTYYWRK